jgi:hypothetical protein
MYLNTGSLLGNSNKAFENDKCFNILILILLNVATTISLYKEPLENVAY